MPPACGPAIPSTCCSPAAASSAVWSGRRRKMTDLKFEDCLSRLEQIVGQLEAGNLSLEESLKVFEEGVGLARHCTKYLTDAERRIELLAKDDTGALTQKPFAFDADQEA